MTTYIAYWKRGWWTWLLMLLANLSLGALIVPLALLLGRDAGRYYVCAMLAWIVVGAPVWGWLFERFAEGSPRIRADDFDHLEGTL